MNLEKEKLEQEQHLENRFGFYKEKTTEELESILEKLIKEREEDKLIFENTNNGNKKLDAHNDIIQETDEINYIEGLLQDRKGKSR